MPGPRITRRAATWARTKEAAKAAAGSVTAAAALVALLLTAQANHNSDRANREQARIMEQGQATDRFIRAVDQLGSDKPEVVIGAMYSLERISKDSPDDAVSVREILAAYVRNHAGSHETASDEKLAIRFKDPAAMKFKNPSPQVVTAMSILARMRQGVFDASSTVDLSRIGLRALSLDRARLPGVDLSYALLASAHLADADLSGSRFFSADLSYADLHGVDLSGSDLTNTNLTAANLKGADLRGANLGCSRLIGAFLDGADMRGTRMSAATLSSDQVEKAIRAGADLKGYNPGPGLFGGDTLGLCPPYKSWDFTSRLQ